jgi:hypothetical protein
MAATRRGPALPHKDVIQRERLSETREETEGLAEEWEKFVADDEFHYFNSP